LGIEIEAKETEIKKVYRALALQWHPDRNNKDDEQREKAVIMMALINEANEILLNP
jgi:curved DNA-binding protein CbpA